MILRRGRSLGLRAEAAVGHSRPEPQPWAL